MATTPLESEQVWVCHLTGLVLPGFRFAPKPELHLTLVQIQNFQVDVGRGAEPQAARSLPRPDVLRV